MKYLQKYKIFESKSFDEKELEFIFAHTFDLSNRHSIDIIYFHPDTNEWANNDWSDPNSENHPNECVIGYAIYVHFKYHDDYDIELDFKHFLYLINELDSDMDRFKSIYNPRYISYNLNSDLIEIIIKP